MKGWIIPWFLNRSRQAGGNKDTQYVYIHFSLWAGKSGHAEVARAGADLLCNHHSSKRNVPSFQHKPIPAPGLGEPELELGCCPLCAAGVELPNPGLPFPSLLPTLPFKPGPVFKWSSWISLEWRKCSVSADKSTLWKYWAVRKSQHRSGPSVTLKVLKFAFSVPCGTSYSDFIWFNLI